MVMNVTLNSVVKCRSDRVATIDCMSSSKNLGLRRSEMLKEEDLSGPREVGPLTELPLLTYLSS